MTTPPTERFQPSAYIVKMHADYNGKRSTTEDEFLIGYLGREIYMKENDPGRPSTGKWVDVSANFHDIAQDRPGIYEAFEKLGYPKGSVWGLVSDTDPNTSMMTFRMGDAKKASEVTLFSAVSDEAAFSGDVLRVVDVGTKKEQAFGQNLIEHSVSDTKLQETAKVLAAVFDR
jgi:hypothetical protein